MYEIPQISFGVCSEISCHLFLFQLLKKGLLCCLTSLCLPLSPLLVTTTITEVVIMRLTGILLLALRLCGIEKISPHWPLHRKGDVMMGRFRTTLTSMSMATLLVHHLHIYIKSWLGVTAAQSMCNPLQYWQLAMGSTTSS